MASKPNSIHFSYVFVAMGTLLTSSFLDNLRGPLLPLMAKEFSISYTESGGLLVAAHIAAAITTLLMVPIFRHYSDRFIVFAVSFFALLVCFLPQALSSFTMIQLWSVGIGIIMSIMGTLCNVLMVHGLPSSLLSRGMSALHAMYGLGSMVAPITLTFILGQGFGWRSTLAVPALACLGLAVASIYLSTETGKDRQRALKTQGNEKHSAFELRMLIPPIVFSLYVVGEVLTSMWMTSYLNKELNLSLEDSASYMSWFFLVLLSTRLLSVVFATPRVEKTLLVSSMVFSALSFTLGLLGWLPGFIFAGLLGPFYPLYMARVTQDFPHASRFVTVLIIMAIQLSLAASHGLFGLLSDSMGIRFAYFIPPVALTLAMLGSLYPLSSEQNAR